MRAQCRGLGILCNDDDFHCDNPEGHIENLPLKDHSTSGPEPESTNKPETDEPEVTWTPEPPKPRTQLLVKLLSLHARLRTGGSHSAAGYDLHIAVKKRLSLLVLGNT